MKSLDMKALKYSVFLVLLQPILYFLAKVVQNSPTVIGNIIDTRIPFVMVFIIPYIFWYLLLFVIPYYFYIKDKNTFKNYTISYIICLVISVIVFTIYPTTVNRPEIIGNGALAFITKFIFFFDTPPVNCFPSIHCEISTLFILYILNCKGTKNEIKVSVIMISLLIMIATLFIKQHVFIDLVGGVLLSTISYLLSKIISKKINI